MPRARSLRGVLLLVGFAILLFAGLGAFVGRLGYVAADPQSLLRRLPTQDAVVVGVNFDSLRTARVLAFLKGSKTVTEPEYASFVRETGFDYQRDLDSVLASFAPDGEFFLVSGRFDWPKLESYIHHQGGKCARGFCQLAGSTPQKKISFFLLSQHILAMAVAPDENAANRLCQLGPQGDVNVPSQPVWITWSAGALRHATSLPGSTALFASAIADAQRVTITAGPSGAQLDARLEAICRDAQQAGVLTEQLRAFTGMLKTEAAQEGRAPTPVNIGMLLASGAFEQAGSHVLGRWPIPKELIANLSDGGI